MGEIRVLLHVPDYEEVCALTMLRHIKHLVNVISSSHTMQDEWWQVDFDDEKMNAAVYTHGVRMGEYCSEGSKSITKNRIAQVASTIWYDDQHVKGKLCAGITAVPVRSAQYHRLPRDTGERWISLHMTRYLWDGLDQNLFIQRLKEIYCALNATYACIDEEAPIGGICEASFRLMADSASEADLENKLPGIYWLQIVSSEFISRTGSLSEVMDNAPCEHVELIDAGQQKALLLQISSHIKDASRNKRLKMREFFKESLYNMAPDIDNLSVLANIRYYKYMTKTLQRENMRTLRMIPLTDDELRRVMEMIEAAE